MMVCVRTRYHPRCKQTSMLWVMAGDDNAAHSAGGRHQHDERENLFTLAGSDRNGAPSRCVALHTRHPLPIPSPTHPTTVTEDNTRSSHHPKGAGDFIFFWTMSQCA